MGAGPPAPDPIDAIAAYLPLVLSKPALRIRDVREGSEEVPVVGVDAVAERELRPLEEAADGLLGDVDDVVTEAPAVRPALVVAREHAHPVRVLRDRDGEVQAQELREPRAREVELRNAGEQHRDEVVTVGLGAPSLYSLLMTAARMGES